MWENTTPSTELPRDFYAGIDPLQLGVVLVVHFISNIFFNNLLALFAAGLPRSTCQCQYKLAIETAKEKAQ